MSPKKSSDEAEKLSHEERKKIKEWRQPENYGDGYSDGLTPLTALDLSKCKTVNDLVSAMGNTSFGGREVGEAADVLEAMVRDKKCFKVLTLSGAMTIAKMGLVVCDMIDLGMVDAVVSTGALITHGFVETVGGRHFKYKVGAMDDKHLYHKGYNRVYDTLELEKNLDDTEKVIDAVLKDWPKEKELYSCELNRRLGEYLSKHTKGRGILKSAFQKNVPIYIPAFTDSEMALDVGTYRRRQILRGEAPLKYNPFYDLEDYTERVLKSDKLGIFTIGGGVPRNWAQQVGPYLDIIESRVGVGGGFKRFHYAVRVCPEPVHWGGLCLHGDTKIDTPRDLSIYPDGIPIKDLVGKSNFPIYSYDPSRGKICLSNVRGVWPTGRKKLYKIRFGWIAGWSSQKQELRTGQIIASEDHKFMFRDGSFRKVSELKENDRLMPFNSYLKSDKHGDYRFLFLNNGIKVPEHRFIMQEITGREISKEKTVHHMDHNTLNNNIENLELVGFADHAAYHRYAQTRETEEKRIRTLKENCNPEEMKEKSRKFWDNLSDEEYDQLCEKRKAIALTPEESIRRSGVSKKYWGAMNSKERLARLENAHLSIRMRWASLPPDVRSAIQSKDKNGRWIKGITEEMIKDSLKKEKGVLTRSARCLGVSTKVFSKRVAFYGIDKNQFRQNAQDNHFVISIEPYGEDETFDITVDNTHNFAANGIIVSNSGCSYAEGVSWGKFVPPDEGGMQVEVLEDATVAWPFIMKAVMERLEKAPME